MTVWRTSKWTWNPTHDTGLSYYRRCLLQNLSPLLLFIASVPVSVPQSLAAVPPLHLPIGVGVSGVALKPVVSTMWATPNTLTLLLLAVASSNGLPHAFSKGVGAVADIVGSTSSATTTPFASLPSGRTGEADVDVPAESVTE